MQIQLEIVAKVEDFQTLNKKLTKFLWLKIIFHLNIIEFL